MQADRRIPGNDSPKQLPKRLPDPFCLWIVDLEIGKDRLVSTCQRARQSGCKPAKAVSIPAKRVWRVAASTTTGATHQHTNKARARLKQLAKLKPQQHKPGKKHKRHHSPPPPC
ncbi:hypothetical protein T4E_1517 [Trichinella pseudospiralis]|uniref:Uncharacterized protein n=1 Tax=Trichinella pseudospiralis TaxID=6337 RepID=A0A0V0XRH9_TRIPS|nr:hypothetical protein T4E_1517 [Trichinella pseudospiralis]